MNLLKLKMDVLKEEQNHGDMVNGVDEADTEEVVGIGKKIFYTHKPN